MLFVTGSICRDDVSIVVARLFATRSIHVLLFFKENARNLVFTGDVVVGDRSGEDDFSLDEVLLLADSDRCLVSSRTSSRLTLS